MGQPDESEWGQLGLFLLRGDTARTFALGMTAQSMSKTLWAAATVGRDFPTDASHALLAAIGDAKRSVVPDMKAQDVAKSIWALGRLAWAVPEPTMTALSGDIVRVQGDMKPQHVSNTLRGLAGIQVVAAPGFAVPARVQTALLLRLCARRLP
jgi:hypothetical protein